MPSTCIPTCNIYIYYNMKRFFGALILAAILLASCAPAENLTENTDTYARLNELGYLWGASGEISPEALSRAIYNFQLANSLPATGNLDPTTVQALYGADAIGREEYVIACFSCEATGLTILYGSKGNAVKELQSVLVSLGYLTSEPDGIYGETTLAAVALFQTVNGLEITGEGDENTLARLKSASAVPLAGFEDEAEIGFDDKGASVKALQTLLYELGYFEGEITGIFGAKTLEAVNDFRQRNGLEQTGIWTPALTALVKKGVYMSKSASEVAESAYVFTVGGESYMIKETEAALALLGYFEGEPDEIYDELTENAVLLFQEANGLDATGECDGATRQRLKGDCVTFDAYAAEQAVCALKLGDESYGVYLFTLRLSALGYPVTPTRMYTDDIALMVSIFQRSRSMEQTGNADEYTRALINDENAPAYSEVFTVYSIMVANDEYVRKHELLLSTALSCCGARYEAGMTGPESYGMGGLTYHCYLLSGAELAPTVAKQYESASSDARFDTSPQQPSEVCQVFFRAEENYLTGIYVGDGKVIYASASEGEVIEVSFEELSGKYTYIGAIDYFE